MGREVRLGSVEERAGREEIETANRSTSFESLALKRNTKTETRGGGQRGMIRPRKIFFSRGRMESA